MDAPGSRQTHRILLVDDQPTLIEWVRLVFAEQPDFQLSVCSDPFACVEVARREKPSLILQDLLLPRRHGFEILADYRACAELIDTPVIVLSSIEDVAEKGRAFELGVADYVVKMPHPIELVARVRAHSRAYLERRALASAREELRLTLEYAPTGTAMVALDGRFLYVNDTLCRILGREREELLSIGFQQVTHPEDLGADQALFEALLRGERATYQLTKRYIRADGFIVSVLLSVALVRSDDGKPRFLIGQIIDMTAQIEAERQAAQQSSVLRAVIDSMHDAVMVMNTAGELLLTNEVAKRLFGPMLQSGIPNDWAPGYGLFLADGVTRCMPEQYPLARALRGEAVDEVVLWMMMPGWSQGQWHSVTGSPVRDASGKLIGAVNVGRDITARIEAQERIRESALRDELTGISNRRGFTLLAEQQLKLSDRAGVPVFAMFVDLDDMKTINDQLGHDAGDAALIATAQVLRGACRSSDIIARLGGDEFAILAEGNSGAAAVLRDRIVAAAHRAAFAERRTGLSLSIGIAVRTAKSATSLAELLSAADQAMYEVKRGRKPSTAGIDLIR